MTKRIFVVLAFVTLFATNRAMAWGGFAHSAITEIAERNLTDKAREQIHHYLNHSLPFYAIWMDQFRYTDPYRPSGKWHSNWMDESGAVDMTNDKCAAYQTTRIWKAMKNYRNMTDEEVRLNLLYLIHLVADMHCPCHNVWPKKSHPHYYYHLTNNKGGKESFHKYWDNTAITYGRKKWTATYYANKMATLSEKEIKRICKGTPYKWAVSSLPNAERTFELTPKGSNVQKYSKADREEMRRICDEEAVKAGYRLAYVMNQIFSK